MTSIHDLGRDVATTPALLLDVGSIERRIADVTDALAGSVIRYPIKVNPDPTVLRTIAEAGQGFDAASFPEILAAVAAGGDPARIVFAAPVKAESHIVQARAIGVTTFVADSPEEVAKIARSAAGASVLVRVAVSNAGSVFALTEKFGATVDESLALLDAAEAAGLRPAGAAFHVGSQALDPGIWTAAITHVTPVLERVAAHHGGRPILDIGGGFPRAYGDDVPSFDVIAAAISRAVADLPMAVELVVEPGRLLVADAGTVVSSVIGVATHGGARWAYLDAGTYNVLFEALTGQGSFRYPVRALDGDDRPHVPWIVAGPSCDSLDRIGGTHLLPADLAAGDRVLIGRTGAYSTAFASAFCGWAPPTIVAARVTAGTDPDIRAEDDTVIDLTTSPALQEVAP